MCVAAVVEWQVSMFGGLRRLDDSVSVNARPKLCDLTGFPTGKLIMRLIIISSDAQKRGININSFHISMSSQDNLCFFCSAWWFSLLQRTLKRLGFGIWDSVMSPRALLPRVPTPNPSTGTFPFSLPPVRELAGGYNNWAFLREVTNRGLNEKK